MKIFVLLFFLVSLSACAHRPTVDALECGINEFCKAQGMLSMVNAEGGWFGVLEGKTACMVLALPESVQNNHAQLDNKLVVATGVVREMPSLPGAVFVAWSKINGRPITSHRCTGRYMWVDRVVPTTQ